MSAPESPIIGLRVRSVPCPCGHGVTALEWDPDSGEYSATCPHGEGWFEEAHYSVVEVMEMDRRARRRQMTREERAAEKAAQPPRRMTRDEQLSLLAAFLERQKRLYKMYDGVIQGGKSAAAIANAEKNLRNLRAKFKNVTAFIRFFKADSKEAMELADRTIRRLLEPVVGVHATASVLGLNPLYPLIKVWYETCAGHPPSQAHDGHARRRLADAAFPAHDQSAALHVAESHPEYD